MGKPKILQDIDTVSTQLQQKASQSSLNDANNTINVLQVQKADKSEVTNVMTPKGSGLYASLPTTGNEVGWYYYCPDGDGANGAGNYVWNGTLWYFGGTGDNGYNKLRIDLSEYGVIENVAPIVKSNGFINASGVFSANASLQLSEPITLNYGDKIIVNARGWINSTCIIAAYHEQSNTYLPLVIATSSISTEYSFKNFLSDDLKVVISAYIDTGWSAYIRKSKNRVDYVANVLEAKKNKSLTRPYYNYYDYKFGIGGIDGNFKPTLNNQRLVTYEFIDLSGAGKVIFKCDNGYSYNINTYSKSGSVYTKAVSYGWKIIPTIIDFYSRSDTYVQMMIMKNDSSELKLSDITHIDVYSIKSNFVFETDLTSYDSLIENVTWSDTEGFIYSSSRIGFMYPIKCDFDVTLHLKNPEINSINYFYFSGSEASIVNKTYTSGWTNNKYIVVPKNTWFSVVVRHLDNSNLDTGEFANIVEIVRYVDGTYLKYVTDGGFLPSYYHENNYLENKVSSIKALARNCCVNGDIFAFITDLHWSINAKKSPLLLKYLSEKLNIPRLFLGGDFSDGYSDIMHPVFRSSFDGKIYSLTGNHEYFNYTKGKDLYYEINVFNDDALFGNVERNYYYVDNNQQKIRYVVLSAYSEGIAQWASSDGYEEEQVNWLSNVALNVESGWTIIVFTHALYNIRTDDTCYLANNAGNIVDAINNYSGNGTIACIIQGHTHRDRIIRLTSGVPCICTTSDKHTIHHEGEFNVLRSDGTISEQAFDIILVDKTNKKIYFVRIGAKARDGIGDLAGNEVEIREVSY